MEARPDESCYMSHKICENQIRVVQTKTKKLTNFKNFDYYIFKKNTLHQIALKMLVTIGYLYRTGGNNFLIPTSL